MPVIPRITPLLERLARLLNKHRFKREPDELEFAIFGRKLDGCIERIGILPVSGSRENDDVAFSVSMGLEFSDLGPERSWLRMPRTHGAVELRLLNKAAKKVYVCSTDSDSKELATRLAEQIVVASQELQRRSEKLRKAYLSLVEARGSNVAKRLAFFGEQKAKEAKARKPKGKLPDASLSAVSVNVFEMAAKLLRSKTDQKLTVEMQAFDDREAHDRRRTERIVKQMIDRALVLQAELAHVLDAPHETGTTEHRQLPINGVRYFAWWNVGRKSLFLAVSHEDVGLPCCLLLGALARK